MTWTKLLIIMATLSLASAGAVALVSRTPAELRNAAPGPEAEDAALGASFTDAQIERSAAYRGSAYLGTLLSTIIPIVLLVLLAKGPFGELVERVQKIRGGWPVHALLLAAALTALTTVFLLPLGFVRGYSIATAWGLSTQNVGGWISDQLRGLLVGIVIAAVSGVAFFAVVRWVPRTWWLWGWGVFTALTVLLVFLYPVAIAPLFNKFTSLPDGPLRERILTLGSDAGVPLSDVLVADASRRTTSENAYVTGLGATKRMVLYDTLIENGGEDETVFVAAHELGHKVENHVVKNVIISSVGLLAGFALLFWLTRRAGFLGWAGAESVADLRVIPLMLLYLTAASLVTLPLESGISRSFEKRADEIAIELTHDPLPGVRAFRRLAFANLADLKPNALAVWALFSHPPIPDRIEALLEDPAG